jgi:hypothetical protein
MPVFNACLKENLCALIIVSASLPAVSQTITLTSPTVPVVAPEGDEFFTDVVKDRKDFDKRRDFLWEENFNEPTVDAVGGNWFGNTLTLDAYVFPLHPGFGDSPVTPGDDSALNLGATGDNFPIDSGKYTYITYRDTVSDRSARVLYWSDIVLFPDGSLFKLAEDAYATNTQFVYFPVATPVVYAYSLSDDSSWTANPVRALRADPSIRAAPGSSFEFDWFRVSDPDSTTRLSITWETSGIDAPNPEVSIYVDDDAQGFDGSLLATWGKKPPAANEPDPDRVGEFVRPAMAEGVYELPLSGLPPGEYYFYLEVRSDRQDDAELATSGYSAKVTITAKPEVTIESPSMTSGPDYATEMLGDPWDFDNLEDVANRNLPAFQRNFNFVSLTDSVFTGQAIIPGGAPPGQVESDVQGWMNISPQNPVDTSKYRYLSYTLEVDETGFGNIVNKVGNVQDFDPGIGGGWVTRIVWWDIDIDVDGSSTNDIVVYEGLRTYTLDLLPLSVANAGLEPGDMFAAQSGWTGNATLRNLRIDPLEVNDPTNFSLHDVKLRGKSAPTTDGTFDIEFTVADLDSNAISIEVFSDTDQAGADGAMVAGPLTLAPGRHTVQISTQSLGPADLYFYIVASDGSNVSTTYSEAPITFSYTQGGSTAPPSAPAVSSVEFDDEQGALVVVVAPGNGADIVTGYSVTCNRSGGGAFAGSGIGPIVIVSGAEAGETYTCFATASNGSGTSAASTGLVIEVDVLASGLPIWLLEASKN